MAEFYVSLSQEDIAEQIAALLNRHNKLVKIHNKFTIMNSTIKYFVEMTTSGGAIHKPVVIGCVGLLKDNSYLSTVKHLSVDPSYRERGIAKRLVQIAIANCTTDNIRMTIREDNVPSLMLSKAIQFKHITKTLHKDHYVITVGRRRIL